MPGATRTIEVNTSMEKLYNIITDFESYPEFLGSQGLESISIDSQEGNDRIVTQRVKKLGRTINYTMKYTLERPRILSWRLVRGEMMSKNEGFWKLEEIEKQRTRATYSLDVRFGLLVPKTIVNMLILKELPNLLEAFKKRAESE